MAHALDEKPEPPRSRPRWLQIADEVLRDAAAADAYHHAPAPDASVERLRAVAGKIRLRGPVPSHKFLEDEDGGF